MNASFFEINGIKIYRLFLEDALQQVFKQEPQKLFFVNAHTVMVAKDNPRCLQALQHAEVLLNDGLGIDMASFLCTGLFFPDNINGTDFIPMLLQQTQGLVPVYGAGETRNGSGFENLTERKRGFLPAQICQSQTPFPSSDKAPCEHIQGRKVFFLGTTDSTLQKVRSNFETQFPQHKCVGVFHGYFSDPQEPLKAIREARPDILIVGTGTPRQEEFIDTHWDALVHSGVQLAIGGGGIIDFMSGVIPRAPRWMRTMRLEWMYRLYQEPKRLFHRYVIEGMQFVWYVVGQAWGYRRGRRD